MPGVLGGKGPNAILLRDAWARGRIRLSRGPIADVPTAAKAALESAPPRATIDLDCVVFSKDRPMQLDACLRSIVRHAPYRGSITVVFRATTERFRQGYAELDVDTRVRLVPQEADFRMHVLALLHEAGDRIVFHTDDDLFFRKPPCAPLLPEGCASFSLRLGENTTHSYAFAQDQPLPERERVDDFMVWNWRRARTDFAYPMSLDGHLFDSGLLRTLLGGARFRDPNELEQELYLRRHRTPRLMVAFRHSCVVGVPVNVVTESIVNRSGLDPRFTPDALNDLFLEGLRIDLDHLDFSDIRAAHQEVPLSFSRPAGQGA